MCKIKSSIDITNCKLMNDYLVLVSHAMQHKQFLIFSFLEVFNFNIVRKNDLFNKFSGAIIVNVIEYLKDRQYEYKLFLQYLLNLLKSIVKFQKIEVQKLTVRAQEIDAIL